MRIWLLTYNHIAEECDHVRGYLDPIVAQQECDESNRLDKLKDAYNRIRNQDVYHLEEIEVKE